MTGAEGFDVVVVGAGSAGCVVAARLSETSSRTVLLLEAGPDLRDDPPDALRDGWHLPRGDDWAHDWGYVSDPDERGDTEELRRGRLVGGTSFLTRFAVRGSPADYDRWAALGNPGWSFDDVLPAFRGLESDADFGDRPWHGDRGPIPVDRYLDLPLSEMHATALQAMAATGFPIVEDHNEPGAVGAGRMPMSSREGLRTTTADAYLPIGGTPSNLTIRPDAHVAEIVFDGSRARGVRLVDGAVIDAGRVVLCAGTYGSPTVLLRSGVGPAEHLRSAGVPVRVDLTGVGANLADHPGVDLDCGYRGPWREIPLLHVIATFQSASAAGEDPPDLMLWTSDPSGTAEGPTGFEIDVVLLKPRSRGTVRLRSLDPRDPPRIELPGVRDPSDVERLGAAFLRAAEVARWPEVRDLCEGSPTEVPDRADLPAWIRANAYSLPHVVGTCAMGPSPDDGAVVDAAGSVHGTQGLSVIDASIIPEPPSGFPHIIVIMLAERLAERIGTSGQAAHT